jgi:flagellar basal body-associated protein FliL
MKDDSAVVGQAPTDRAGPTDDESGTPRPRPAPGRARRPRDAGKVLPTVLVLNAALGAASVLVAARSDSPDQSMVSAPDGGVWSAALTGSDEGDTPGPIVRLGVFVVQVRAAEGDHHAKVTLDVELAAEDDHKAIDRRMPQIRDMIILYYADRTTEELRGSDGLERVKTDLRRRMDRLVGAGRIRNLFVIDFVIQ